MCVINLLHIAVFGIVSVSIPNVVRAISSFGRERSEQIDKATCGALAKATAKAMHFTDTIGHRARPRAISSFG